MSDVVERLVVVGAGLAGTRACESARREGHTGAITLLGAEIHHPYDRPPLSKQLLTGEDEPILPTLRPAGHLEGLDVELMTGVAATGLDTVGRRVLLGDSHLDYDAVVIACGAQARVIPGTDDIAGVHTVRSIDDARAIWTALRRPVRVVIVGGGFIGAEVATVARARGNTVTVVEADDVPLRRALGEAGGSLVADLHACNGTGLRLGRAVSRITTDGAVRPHVTGVVLDDGSEIDADLVIVGVGARPATGWLRGSGVALDPRDGGVMCTDTLAVRGTDGEVIPGVWAAGDVAWWDNCWSGTPMRLEHWTAAAEQGAAAAANAVRAEPARSFSTVPYFWSDWYDTRIQFAGVAAGDEMVTHHRTDRGGGIVALYRSGDLVAGVLTIGRPDLIMKYRRLLVRATSFSDALAVGAAHV